MNQAGPRAAMLAGALLAAIPVSVLALLAASHRLTPAAAALSTLAIWAGSAILAQLWLAGLLRLITPDAALADPPHADPAVHAQPGEPSTERAILDALPDPLLLLTPDRLLRYANQAARDTLGGELSAVLRHPTLRAAIDRVQGNGQAIQSVDLLLPVPVPRDLHATVIDLGTAAQGGTALLFADRTQARAVERMRADFVANASHELRTPLASLIGFIDTLRGPAVDDAPAQQRFLLIMAEQAARMNRLIDDLLSLSRIELTEHMAPADRLDLAPLIGRTLLSFGPRCTQSGATVRPALQPGLGLVLADADQIEQVLQNLLDNALKYGRPGGTIDVALHPAAGGAWPARPGVVISVSDDGPGIPRADVPRLTERFYRVDRGRSRAAGGTGLGLAIVKHIVNRHRGQLAIDSQEGRGSTFSVWLPLAG